MEVHTQNFTCANWFKSATKQLWIQHEMRKDKVSAGTARAWCAETGCFCIKITQRGIRSGNKLNHNITHVIYCGKRANPKYFSKITDLFEGEISVNRWSRPYLCHHQPILYDFVEVHRGLWGRVIRAHLQILLYITFTQHNRSLCLADCETSWVRLAAFLSDRGLNPTEAQQKLDPEETRSTREGAVGQTMKPTRKHSI